MITGDEESDNDVITGTIEKDKVFALSVSEVEDYFNSNEDLVGQLTDYSTKVLSEQILANDENYSPCDWWLRNIDYDSVSTKRQNYYVDANGKIMTINKNEKIKRGIRPALWIDLAKLEELSNDIK